MRKQMATRSIRLSDADKKALEIAARLTGRTVTKYVRDVSVLCAVRFLIEGGYSDRLPVEHRELFQRELEALTVGDVVGLEKRRGPRKRPAA